MAKAKLYHAIWGACAFLSFISFIQTGSWASDHIGGVRAMWWVIGVASFITGAYFLYKVIKNTGSGGGSSVQ